MLFKLGPERDLIILQNVNGRDVKHRGQVHAFMECRGFCRAISDPGEHGGFLSTLLDRKRHACEYRSQRSNLTHRRDDPIADTTYMQIFAFAGRIRSRQVFT